MERYANCATAVFDYSFKERMTTLFEKNSTLPNAEFMKYFYLA